MSAFEKSLKKTISNMVESFTFNINWDFTGGKRIGIYKFQTIRYTCGLYFAYDNHRGKK